MPHTELAQLLASSREQISSKKVITGFDAFVDEMISVVEERHSLDAYRRVETIACLGKQISAAAGHSSLREIVIHSTDPGGCAVNMGDGLAALGVPVETFATAGEPPHPAFANYAARATLHSWGRQPGHTYAYEFADGKLMFSSVSQFAEFTPQAVSRHLADGHFQRACSEAALIALTDWTLYPHMTECWRLLQAEVFSALSHRPRFFLDLVDPSGRSEADIRAMLQALPGFEACGKTTLGLNQNEANILSRLTGGQPLPEPKREAAEEQAAALREALGISEVVIHARHYATVANAAGCASHPAPYCETPLKSTGAGDRFNAGYALGLLLNRPAPECIALAIATAGLYVRNGRSPDLDALIQFLREWKRTKAQDLQHGQ